MIGQNVLEVIAGTPDCRAIQIADRLDLPAEEVGASLAALLSVGDIVRTEGQAPNGLPCSVYNLSDTFRESAAGAPLAAKAAAKNFQAPGMNRVERAIAFVKERGAATSAELHAVMGLDDTEAPSKVLTSALTTKRLIKQGKDWTLGPGPDGSVAAPSPACAPITREDAQNLPAALVGELSRPAREVAAAAASAPVEVPRFIPVAPEQPTAAAASRSEAEPDASLPSSRVFADMAGTNPTPAPAAAPKGTRARSGKLKAEDVAKALGPKSSQGVVTLVPADSTPAAPDKVIVSLHPASEHHTPVYRCALWSDGVLEVQRDGLTVAEMPQAAGETLASFLSRLAGAKEAA